MKIRGLILFALLIISGSCVDKTPVFESFSGATQGTSFGVTFEKSRKIRKEIVEEGVQKILSDFDASLSLYNANSVISKVNRNEDVTLDQYFIEAFNKSMEISDMSGGVFDITVGPLVDAWGFGPDALKRFDATKLDSLMNLVGYKKVSIRDGKVIKKNQAITLDANAIAQGYSVDVVSEYLVSLGIKNFLVEIGGEVRVKGTKAGEFWRIGIDEPSDDNTGAGDLLEDIIAITDKAVSTSGNYRKFYFENGVKYAHTIDPRTGSPVRHNLLSATILADDCMTADAFATACMVLGKDGAIELIKKYSFLEGYLIYSDDNGNYKIWMTDNFAKLVQGYLN